MNFVTKLIESKRAKLVLIAHDCEPMELLCWMPALCKAKDIPYMIIKGKSRLGQVVNKDQATCLAITSVRKEDEADLAKLVSSAKANFNDAGRPKWGGGILGPKAQHVIAKREKALADEAAKKAGLMI
uniref:Ribosomal protein eL8/eL30/eS12/Gadd45 domain-containing protein n=2 Tax=Oxyrrhis marina TaxID=2969 RepID=A0A7S3XIN8_OXYMA|mmetsp:Transcript_19314/g.47325  ORF Transcript_19314/g.47325 Transcript_19314/m.47325 type:complete len:128 (+) Transcript_19314:477-860(+)